MKTPDATKKLENANAGVKCPEGVCIVCGSVLLLQYWRGHPGNQRIQCNDCGSEVTPLMHSKKQPND